MVYLHFSRIEHLPNEHALLEVAAVDATPVTLHSVPRRERLHSTGGAAGLEYARGSIADGGLSGGALARQGGG